jgi:hypothetical protein
VFRINQEQQQQQKNQNKAINQAVQKGSCAKKCISASDPNRVKI